MEIQKNCLNGAFSLNEIEKSCLTNNKNRKKPINVKSSAILAIPLCDEITGPQLSKP